MPNKRDLPSLTGILDSLNELNLQFAVGRSIVPQFVFGHDHADVLEELIQNEYDAGGNDLQVLFGQDSLVITGNGAVIDDEGWSRLSVILGTGEVPGRDGRVVQPKRNGIGSKNLGLRSLFRVYDAATTEPPFKRFRDPIALYREGDIRLNISSLSGQVEPA
jgi:hypothetical protein